MSYEKKYLKYKNKYLSLKNNLRFIQYGGAAAGGGGGGGGDGGGDGGDGGDGAERFRGGDAVRVAALAFAALAGGRGAVAPAGESEAVRAVRASVAAAAVAGFGGGAAGDAVGGGKNVRATALAAAGAAVGAAVGTIEPSMYALGDSFFKRALATKDESDLFHRLLIDEEMSRKQRGEGPPSPPALAATRTAVAFMDPKATNFNEVINLKRKEWYSLVNHLIIEIILALGPGAFNKAQENYVLNIEDQTYKIIRGDQSQPLVYFLGGSAYTSYDDAINKVIKRKYDIDLPLIKNNAPRTHDWDVSFSLIKDIDEETKRKIKDVLPNLILNTVRTHYDRLANKDYFTRNFKQIIVKTAAEVEAEAAAALAAGTQIRREVQLAVINNYIELSKIETGKFVNYRISLAKEIDNEIHQNHIIELSLWKKLPMQNLTRTVTVVMDDGMQHYLPHPYDLIKSNIISIINRSTMSYKYPKCRQDYMRIKFFITKLSYFIGLQPFQQILTPLLDNLIKYIKKIEPAIPQCIKFLSYDEKREIETTIERSKENHIIINKLLKIFYDDIVINPELLFDLSEDSLIKPFIKSLQPGPK